MIADPENEYVAPVIAPVSKKKVALNIVRSLAGVVAKHSYRIIMYALTSSLVLPFIGWKSVIAMSVCAVAFKYIADFFMLRIAKRIDKILKWALRMKVEKFKEDGKL